MGRCIPTEIMTALWALQCVDAPFHSRLEVANVLLQLNFASKTFDICQFPAFPVCLIKAMATHWFKLTFYHAATSASRLKLGLETQVRRLDFEQLFSLEATPCQHELHHLSFTPPETFEYELVEVCVFSRQLVFLAREIWGNQRELWENQMHSNWVITDEMISGNAFRKDKTTPNMVLTQKITISCQQTRFNGAVKFSFKFSCHLQHETWRRYAHKARGALHTTTHVGANRIKCGILAPQNVGFAS